MKLTVTLALIATTTAAATVSWLSNDTYVVDGDTIHWRGQRVRIWGVDAPETSTPEGRLARAWLTEWLDGREVECVARGSDRYGRVVARCSVDGRGDIAMALVCAGMARDWPRYSGGVYARCR